MECCTPLLLGIVSAVAPLLPLVNHSIAPSGQQPLGCVVCDGTMGSLGHVPSARLPFLAIKWVSWSNAILNGVLSPWLAL